jgi:hypothetical protein
MSEGAASRDRDGPTLLLARLGLVILALILVWLAFDRLDRYQENYARTFRFAVGPVLLAAVAACAGGLAFGLAISIPSATGGYRWARVAAVGALPLALTVVYVIMFSGRGELLPGTIAFRLTLHAEGGLVGSAMLLGIAIVTGLARPRPVPTLPGPTARP